MVNEIWLWVVGIVSYVFGFGFGIGFIIEMFKGFPSIDFEDWDIF